MTKKKQAVPADIDDFIINHCLSFLKKEEPESIHELVTALERVKMFFSELYIVNTINGGGMEQ